MKKTVLRSLAAVAATAIFSTSALAGYKVIANNDLGMHCACPTFAGFLLLPPYNTLRAQVIRTGSEDPSVVNSGLTVSYSLAEESDASLQADPYFSQWITYAPKMFPGYKPVVNGKVVGLTGNGITGTMSPAASASIYPATRSTGSAGPPPVVSFHTRTASVLTIA